MARLGVLLACEHYPHMKQQQTFLDRQLRLWLAALGHEISEVESYHCYDGEFPDRPGQADVWMVSGPSLDWRPCGRDLNGRIQSFLKSAAAVGCPVYGVHCGEHLIHNALAQIGSRPPESCPSIRAIRNPFTSFQSKDRLFCFNPTNRQVEEKKRPAYLQLSGMFGLKRMAA